MADPTPAGSLPVIKEAMQVRFDLRTLAAVVSALIGGVVFCTVFYLKVDNIEKHQERSDQRMERYEAQMERVLDLLVNRAKGAP